MPLLLLEISMKSGLSGYEPRFVFGEYQTKRLIDMPRLVIQDEQGAEIVLGDSRFAELLQLFKKHLPPPTPDEYNCDGGYMG
jgi:hypothetical protein